MKTAIQDLVPGHEIQIGYNKTATVKSVSEGFYLNSKIVTYHDGLWSCYFDTDKVTVLNQ